MRAQLNMKLLGIACLLGCLSPIAPAQQTAAAATPDVTAADAAATAGGTPIDCSGEQCTSADGLLFQLRTRSYDQPATAGSSAASSSAALQPDRRVTVAEQKPGEAVAVGRFSVDLPNGGVIWATEDPDLGRPQLTVSAPSFVAFDGARVTGPVHFAVRSNYPSFIQRLEIILYRGSDTGLTRPIATLPVKASAVAQTDWSAGPVDQSFRAGDTLAYVVRAYGDGTQFDETYPQSIQLVTPQEAEHGNQRLRDTAERSLGSALTVDQAQTQILIGNVFAENGLRLQNIPVYGSRIRIQGRNLPPGRSLFIDGEPYPVDQERKFVAEYLEPVGKHSYDIALQSAAKEQAGVQHETLNIEVTGHYFFAVGLADVTVMQKSIADSADPIAASGGSLNGASSDGRLAMYLKTKIDGKYLITAQADTTEQSLSHVFGGFTTATPQDIFRDLDPDLYYPVYGDDSTTYRDVDTMGHFYVRVDWDKNQALWGNYNTGFTGTEFAQYTRSLYGGAMNWRSNDNNVWGDAKTEVRAFESQVQSAGGHNEFVGTGGSLYYLRNTDILPGSDVVVVEVRDPTTGRLLSTTQLNRGADYEVDPIQGRIILTQPLQQFTRQNVPTLTRDSPLYGYEQVLVVDYEYLPTGFDSEHITGGVRGKQWFGDHVGVGATYVDQNDTGQKYSIEGGDLTLRATKDTYLKAEYVHTESFGAQSFLSTNGGFSFAQTNNTTGNVEGDARSVEAKANFHELGWTTQDWSAGSWWRNTSAGYFTDLYSSGQPMNEYGAEFLGHFTPNLSLYGRYSDAESGAQSLIQAQATLEWRIDPRNTLSGEIRRVEENLATSSQSSTGLLGAVKYDHRFDTSLDVYGLAQVTLDDDGGRYANNNALVAGGKYQFANQSSVNAEVSGGDRGESALVNAEYKLSPTHSIYSGYNYSTDTTAYDTLFNLQHPDGWTFGQRWRLSDQANLYSESQFLKDPQESGLAHTFGMDFYPSQGWNVGFALQTGDLLDDTGGEVNRRALTLSGGHTTPVADWQSKFEVRLDSGDESRTEWVTTNRFSYKVSEDLRVAVRVNYSDTIDALNPANGAHFTEGNVGFAWRPWDSTRWGVFGRYTYLVDLATTAQVGGAQNDQKSRIASLEGVYKYDQHWEFALKVARRDGEAREGRGSGPWFDSGTNFAAVQARYELIHQWHAMAEYRWLDVDYGGNKQGLLVGLDRDLAKNFRIGLGYNFTNFKDDLTNFDYHQRGWFLNATQAY